MDVCVCESEFANANLKLQFGFSLNTNSMRCKVGASNDTMTYILSHKQQRLKRAYYVFTHVHLAAARRNSFYSLVPLKRFANCAFGLFKISFRWMNAAKWFTKLRNNDTHHSHLSTFSSRALTFVICLS